MGKKNSKVFLLLICLALLMLFFGCTNNIPPIPFTVSQFENRVADLNRDLVIDANTDFLGEIKVNGVLGIDVNLSVLDFNSVVCDLNFIKGVLVAATC